MKTKRTERGWAGHFISAHDCRFRRNTLLQYGKKFVVVSTVGNYVYKDKPETIGLSRYYETMAFKSDPNDSVYHDISVSDQVYAPEGTKWAVDKLENDSDNEANDMHEKYVEAIAKMLLSGKIP